MRITTSHLTTLVQASPDILWLKSREPEAPRIKPFIQDHLSEEVGSAVPGTEWDFLLGSVTWPSDRGWLPGSRCELHSVS